MRSSRTPLPTKKTGTTNPYPIASSLVRKCVGGGVAVEQADHPAGEERAEDAFQAEPFGQHGEGDEQEDREPDPDLSGAVLQPQEHVGPVGW
ncbi:MAG: hypothetical protein QOH90_2127 [Actinomycetota bacterium]|nr:hypothetical protein [Actinomycetota bacterium]